MSSMVDALPDLLNKIKQDASLGVQSSVLFYTICFVIFAVQVAMLVYGNLLGLSVSKKASCSRPATIVLHSNKARGPLIRMFSIICSPSHSKALSSSSSQVTLSCLPSISAFALASAAQAGKVTHVMVQNMLMQVQGALLPETLIDKGGADITTLKSDEFVYIHLSKYSGSVFPTQHLSSSLVPIDVGTGIPDFITTANTIQMHSQQASSPSPVVKCLVLAWSWQE